MKNSKIILFCYLLPLLNLLVINSSFAQTRDGNQLSSAGVGTTLLTNTVQDLAQIDQVLGVKDRILELSLNTGDIHLLGDNAKIVASAAWEVTLDLKVRAKKGVTLVKEFPIRLKISQSKPEQLYRLDYSVLGTGVTSFDIVKANYTVTVGTMNITGLLNDNVRLVASLEDQLMYSVQTKGGVGIQPINLRVEPCLGCTNSSTLSKVIFKWDIGTGRHIPSYDLEVLKVEPDINNAVVLDWTKAATIEVDIAEGVAPNYEMTIAEGTGYYFWRVRPVGSYFEGKRTEVANYGLWSIFTNGSASGLYTFGTVPVAIPGASAMNTSGTPQTVMGDHFFYVQFNENINWIYGKVLTEDSRQSETITFANGLNQVQQVQTKLFSQQSVLGSQTVYDYSGRPALKSLIAPFNENKFGYKSDVFQRASDGRTFSAEDFDAGDSKTGSIFNPANLDNTNTGSINNYYSPNNTLGFRPGYIADAKGFPYSRVLYYNDPTGRPYLQSGVGLTMRLDKGTSGRNTSIEYAGVTETELDRIFGNESSNHATVYKVVTTDPNKVVSISYIGKNGKVLATCLSNTGALNNMDQVGNEGVFSVVDRLEPGTFAEGDKVSETFTTVVVDQPTMRINLDYKIKPASFNIPCGAAVCGECDYKVEIDIICPQYPNEKGQNLVMTFDVLPAQLSSLCTDIASAGYLTLGNQITTATYVEPSGTGTGLAPSGNAVIDHVILPKGTYIIKKKVFVNNAFGSTDFLEARIDQLKTDALSWTASNNCCGPYTPDVSDYDCSTVPDFCSPDKDITSDAFKLGDIKYTQFIDRFVKALELELYDATYLSELRHSGQLLRGGIFKNPNYNPLLPTTASNEKIVRAKVEQYLAKLLLDQTINCSNIGHCYLMAEAKLRINIRTALNPPSNANTGISATPKDPLGADGFPTGTSNFSYDEEFDFIGNFLACLGKEYGLTAKYYPPTFGCTSSCDGNVPNDPGCDAALFDAYMGMTKVNVSPNRPFKVSRVEASIAFNNFEREYPACNADAVFGAIWEGYINVPTSTYLYFTADDYISIFIDGLNPPFFMGRNLNGLNSSTAIAGIVDPINGIYPQQLTAGLHKIKVKYYNNRSYSHLRLGWDIGNGVEIIPFDAFTPTTAECKNYTNVKVYEVDKFTTPPTWAIDPTTLYVPIADMNNLANLPNQLRIAEADQAMKGYSCVQAIFNDNLSLATTTSLLTLTNFNSQSKTLKEAVENVCYCLLDNKESTIPQSPALNTDAITQKIVDECKKMCDDKRMMFETGIDVYVSSKNNSLGVFSPDQTNSSGTLLWQDFSAVFPNQTRTCVVDLMVGQCKAQCELTAHRSVDPSRLQSGTDPVYEAYISSPGFKALLEKEKQEFKEAYLYMAKVAPVGNYTNTQDSIDVQKSIVDFIRKSMGDAFVYRDRTGPVIGATQQFPVQFIYSINGLGVNFTNYYYNQKMQSFVYPYYNNGNWYYKNLNVVTNFVWEDKNNTPLDKTDDAGFEVNVAFYCGYSMVAKYSFPLQSISATGDFCMPNYYTLINSPLSLVDDYFQFYFDQFGVFHGVPKLCEKQWDFSSANNLIDGSYIGVSPIDQIGKVFLNISSTGVVGQSIMLELSNGITSYKLFKDPVIWSGDYNTTMLAIKSAIINNPNRLGYFRTPVSATNFSGGLELDILYNLAGDLLTYEILATGNLQYTGDVNPTRFSRDNSLYNAQTVKSISELMSMQGCPDVVYNGICPYSYTKLPKSGTVSLGQELVKNGDFSQPTGGWFTDANNTNPKTGLNGVFNVSGSLFFDKTILIPGKKYRVEFDLYTISYLNLYFVTSYSAPNSYYNIAAFEGPSVIGHKSFDFIATSNILFIAGGGFVLTLDNISVKEILNYSQVTDCLGDNVLRANTFAGNTDWFTQPYGTQAVTFPNQALTFTEGVVYTKPVLTVGKKYRLTVTGMDPVTNNNNGFVYVRQFNKDGNGVVVPSGSIGETRDFFGAGSGFSLISYFDYPFTNQTISPGNPYGPYLYYMADESYLVKHVIDFTASGEVLEFNLNLGYNGSLSSTSTTFEIRNVKLEEIEGDLITSSAVAFDNEQLVPYGYYPNGGGFTRRSYTLVPGQTYRCEYTNELAPGDVYFLSILDAARDIAGNLVNPVAYTDPFKRQGKRYIDFTPVNSNIQIFYDNEAGHTLSEKVKIYKVFGCEVPEVCEVCMKWYYPEIKPINAKPIEKFTCEDLKQEFINNEVDNYLDNCLKNSIATLTNNYKTTCLNNIDDEFNISYDLSYHHYTLYYYDRADNLIRTVPPEGVKFLSVPQIAQVQNYRKNKATNPSLLPVYNSHNLNTIYIYNSIKQLIRQTTPDGGVSRFWYNAAGQLVLSQDARQAAFKIGTVSTPKYSYSRYDRLGRVVEVGELSGFVPTFSDGATQQVVAQLWTNANFPNGFGVKSEVVTTTFTAPEPGISLNGNTQQYLRNRVSKTSTDDGFVTYYSYDPHGNVEWLIQEINGLGRKTMRYEYDLISGKVNQVYYNENTPEQFIHRYKYDEDNRILAVYTSTNGVIWDKDCSYNYYTHGPLARMELGEDNIQGQDYTYTLEGYMKSVNQAQLTVAKDPGQDGGAASTFLKDEFGMELGYYRGDYDRSGTFIGTDNSTANPFAAGGPMALSGANDNYSLFNGNISYWMSNTRTGNDNTKVGAAMDMHMGVYRYDKLNRIKKNDFKQYNGTNWTETGKAYDEEFTYDANGNIVTAVRYGGTTSSGPGYILDNLNYNYSIATNNQLNSVREDADGYLLNADGSSKDIDNNQSAGNYVYDAIGNLIEDKSESQTIEWNLQRKVSRVTNSKDPAKIRQTVFEYDASGNRVYKMNFENAVEKDATFYVRDASGNVMAVYKKEFNSNNKAEYRLTEQPIYGSSRVGEYRPNLLIADPTALPGMVDNFDSYRRGSMIAPPSGYIESQVKTGGTFPAADLVARYIKASLNETLLYNLPKGTDLSNKTIQLDLRDQSGGATSITVTAYNAQSYDAATGQGVYATYTLSSLNTANWQTLKFSAMQQLAGISGDQVDRLLISFGAGDASKTSKVFSLDNLMLLDEAPLVCQSATYAEYKGWLAGSGPEDGYSGGAYLNFANSGVEITRNNLQKLYNVANNVSVAEDENQNTVLRFFSGNLDEEPQELSQLFAEYFDNTDLLGEPVFVTRDSKIDFVAGASWPATSLLNPIGQFSVRWTGLINVPKTADYTFLIKSDDGVRMYLDGVLILNDWNKNLAIDIYSRALANGLTIGKHDIVLEYVNLGGPGNITLSLVENIPVALSTTSRNIIYQPFNLITNLNGPFSNGIIGQYNCSAGSTSRLDANIDFNWGTGSPGIISCADNFNVNWLGAYYSSGGAKAFGLLSDDGSRLSIDGTVLIDNWGDHGPTLLGGVRNLPVGLHFLGLNYYEKTGGSVIQLLGGANTPSNTPVANSNLYAFATETVGGAVVSGLRARYYNSTNFNGLSRYIKIEPSMNLNWGNSSPDQIVPSNNFSARFDGTFNVATRELVQFYMTTAERARIIVDGTVVVQNGALTSGTEAGMGIYKGSIMLAAGAHTIMIEYVELTGSASLQVQWSLPTSLAVSTIVQPSALTAFAPDKTWLLSGDGNTIVDKNHRIKAGYKTKSIAVKAPNATDRYYLVTGDKGALYYHVVSANKTATQVNEAELNLPIMVGGTPLTYEEEFGIAAYNDQTIAAANQVYLAIRKNNTIQIYSTVFNATGLNAATLIRTYNDQYCTGAGCTNLPVADTKIGLSGLQVSPAGNQLALVMSNGVGTNQINSNDIAHRLELFSINNANANLTYTRGLVLGTEPRAPYTVNNKREYRNKVMDFDFSENGTYVYYLQQGCSSDLNACVASGSKITDLKKIDALTIGATPQAQFSYMDDANYRAELRRGYDKKLYVSRRKTGTNTPGKLDVYENTETTLLAAGNLQISASATLYGVPLQAYRKVSRCMAPIEYVVSSQRNTGLKVYELSDHLGNVRAVLSDVRVTTLSTAAILTSQPDVINMTDYYAFGMEMPGRAYNAPDYRYGFNGMEKDDEQKGSGNSYDFGARMYDSRLGRWMSVDPLRGKYPYASPYNFALNTPVQAKDPDGNLVIFINGFWGYGTGASNGGNKAYWNYGKNSDGTQDNWADAAMNSIKDHHARYYDGSNGGLWSQGLDSKLSSGQRVKWGYSKGTEEAAKIISSLKRDPNDPNKIIESVKFITNSMGAAYQRGFSQALVDYVTKYNDDVRAHNTYEEDIAHADPTYSPNYKKEISGFDIEFTVDLAAFQGYSLEGDENSTFRYYMRSLKDYVAGYDWAKVKYAGEIGTNSDGTPKSTGHHASHFPAGDVPQSEKNGDKKVDINENE